MRKRVDRHTNASQLITVSFGFDTPGLKDGITIHVPTPGDFLLEGWMEVYEKWDGVTPKTGGAWPDPVGDLNPTNSGFWQQMLGGIDLSIRADPLLQYAGIAGGFGGRISTAGVMRLWVSQDGAAGGPDPGATKGKATVYLIVLPG